LLEGLSLSDRKFDLSQDFKNAVRGFEKASGKWTQGALEQLF
jgi:hypothetical protein